MSLRRVQEWLAAISMLVGAGALAGGVGVLTSPTVAASSAPYTVYVDHADSLSANPSNFPTPWLGDPGVSFQGCGTVPNCTYDGGAVRIVNSGQATPLTIDNVSVDVGGFTYQLWSQATVPFGGSAIYAQTASGAPNGARQGRSPGRHRWTPPTSEPGASRGREPALNRT